MALKDFDNDYIRRFDDGRIIMTWREFFNASEEEQIAEMIGMGIEYVEEYDWLEKDLKPFRDIYKNIVWITALSRINGT